MRPVVGFGLVWFALRSAVPTVQAGRGAHQEPGRRVWRMDIDGEWASGRMGEMAYGRLGVWAYGKLFWAYGVRLCEADKRHSNVGWRVGIGGLQHFNTRTGVPHEGAELHGSPRDGPPLARPCRVRAGSPRHHDEVGVRFCRGGGRGFMLRVHLPLERVPLGLHRGCGERIGNMNVP